MANIVEIKPLDIEKLDKRRRLAGRTTVYSRMKLYKYKARIYRCPPLADNDAELYKVVIRRRHVIGYCMVFVDEDNYLDIPLLATLDRHYRLGKILSQIAIDRMFDLNCKGIKLIASWNSLLHHYRTGFIPCPQKKIDGRLCDEILAKGDLKQCQKLGCIVMYLPQEVIRNRQEESKLLDDSRLDTVKGSVGRVKIWNKRRHCQDLFNIVKIVHASGIEDIVLMFKRRRIALITLNYFYRETNQNGKTVYRNCLEEYPSWSVFSCYGDDTSRPNKTFAEYWDIRETDVYDADEILKILFKCALEAGAYHGCPLLQIEADWDEHAAVYRYGFRTQNCMTERSSTEIAALIEKEAAKLKRNKGSLNFNKLGSVEMIMDKERAVELGYEKIRVLNVFGRWQRLCGQIRQRFGAFFHK